MFLIIFIFLRIYNIHCILKKHLEVYFSEIHQVLTSLPVFALGLKSNRELVCMIARQSCNGVLPSECSTGWFDEVFSADTLTVVTI